MCDEMCITLYDTRVTWNQSILVQTNKTELGF